ncbi:MAG: transposase [Puniceicoccales bacterium]|nr:transposase [Puniceicoccales bacterium]
MSMKTTDGEVFNAWVEQSLVAALKPGQVVLMDNAAFHKHPRTREAIEAAGCSLIYHASLLSGPQSHRKILGEPQMNTSRHPPSLPFSLRCHSVCFSGVR